MFINITNHPSSAWKREQADAAEALGGAVVDMSFPMVPSAATEEQVQELAQEIETKVLDMLDGEREKSAVHIMGEMTLVFAVVQRLKGKGIRCVASTTERIVENRADGQILKEFRFVKFREY